MKDEQNYVQDLAEIRTMMERSTKFLSLSGWAGIMAGIYALAGAYIAYSVFHFKPDEIIYREILPPAFPKIVSLAVIVLILAIGTAIFLSCKKADKRGEKVWNSTSRRLISSMAFPLATGGILVLVLLSKGLIGLIAPMTLLFYGLALFSASKFTYNDVKFLGLIQVVLGLISIWLIDYSILFWGLGFDVVHIIYGIYMYIRYER